MSAQGPLHVVAQTDGFGSRQIDQDPVAGRVEVLQVSAALARPADEQAIRARAARVTHRKAPVLAPVHQIRRIHETLTVTTAVPEGATLADLLAALEARTLSLTDQVLLEVAGLAVRAVAALHEVPGGLTHGALNPAHVLFCRDGSVLLTGAVFADALQALGRNREQLWREFAVALPPSASLPRFDQRADVTQVGALVLALFMRRPLRPAEYPRGVTDLVMSITDVAGSAACGSALRMWLQQALQLHAKGTFGSAVDAARAYGQLGADVSGRRAAAQTVQAVIREMCGEPATDPIPTPVSTPVPAAVRTAPAPIVLEPQPQPASRGFGLLRHVLRAT